MGWFKGGGTRVQTSFRSNYASSSYMVVIQSACSNASLMDFGSTMDMNAEKWHSFWIPVAERVCTPTLGYQITWFGGWSFVQMCNLGSSCAVVDPISTVELICSPWMVWMWGWCSPWTSKPERLTSSSEGNSKKCSLSSMLINLESSKSVATSWNPSTFDSREEWAFSPSTWEGWNGSESNGGRLRIGPETFWETGASGVGVELCLIWDSESRAVSDGPKRVSKSTSWIT